MSSLVLQSEALGLSRGGRRLLDGVTLDIVAGRTLVVLGANGAGKSLLLRVLHGLVAPDEGCVTRHGRPLERATRDRQAMVFQRPVLLRRSVAGNLAFALAARGIRGAERRERLAEGLELARLVEQAGQPARELSGGEQQRLATARALISRPDLLFLDEPTASLDPASTAAIEALIIEARRRGTACVLVTQSAAQARRLADDLVFLQSGRVTERGDATALDQPASNALADWLAGRLPIRTHEPTSGASAQHEAKEIQTA